jgi:peptidoglycan hydrolase FlgJ
MLNVNNADVYTDFNGLANLKAEARKNSPEAMKEVAKQFESIFLNNVLKGMREAKLADSITDNDQSKFYNDMYDQQLAVHLSGKPGVGLADLIVKQLNHDQPDNKKMGIEDYLNRSSSSNKTVSHASRSAEKPDNRKDDGRINNDLAVFKSYIHDNGQVDTIAELPLKDSHSRPIQSAEDFVHKLYPYAAQAAKELGVEPKVLLAQAALETGWGRSVIKNSDGSSSFNLFNIKASKSWYGNQVHVPTLEFEQGVAKKVNAGFRSYASYQESFQDYVNFIKSNPRYGDALKQVANGGRYLHELQQAGYATDPSYANKIMGIYHGNTMAEFTPQTVVALQ